MVQVVVNCPFCHAQKMAMEILGAIETHRPRSISHQISTYEHSGTGAAACRKCNNAISLTFKWRSEKYEKDFKFIESLSQKNGQTADSLGVSYQVAIPQPKVSKIPKHLPKRVERAFVQAEKNMAMDDCAEAAVIMYRRTLEISIASHALEIIGKNLSQKIDNLQARGIIPESVKDWAHEVRMIGNDGAHEIEGVERSDAEAAQAFTTAFLQYLISLPEEIKLRRQKAAPASNS